MSCAQKEKKTEACHSLYSNPLGCLDQNSTKLYSCLQLGNLAQNKKEKIYEVNHVKITWIGYIHLTYWHIYYKVQWNCIF